MPRYFIRARRTSDDDEYWSEPQAHVTTVCDHEAIDTGLVDPNGNTILRAPNPMGFGKDDEW